MNKDALKVALKVDCMSFTKEEIENIMDEELAKAPEKMDAELIDMCLDILTGELKEKADEKITDSSAVSGKKVKVINIKKGFFVAAIIMVIITIAIPVGAGIFDIDIPESILKVYDEYFRINMDGESDSEDLDTLLAENNLKDVILPKFLFSDCEITDFVRFSGESANKVSFNYINKKENISGKVTIGGSVLYADFFDGKTLIDRQYEGAREVVVNGISVVVFNDENETYIVYSVDKTEYSIMLYDVTVEQVIEIAETL